MNNEVNILYLIIQISVIRLDSVTLNTIFNIDLWKQTRVLCYVSCHLNGCDTCMFHSQSLII